MKENDDINNLAFKIMYKSEKVGYVNYNSTSGELITEIYVDELFKSPWKKGIEVDIDYINRFLEDRCFERGRGDRDEILRGLGLSTYNVEGIIRKTHGLMAHDYLWINFDDEGEIDYEDIKIRR